MSKDTNPNTPDLGSEFLGVGAAFNVPGTDTPAVDVIDVAAPAIMEPQSISRLYCDQPSEERGWSLGV